MLLQKTIFSLIIILLIFGCEKEMTVAKEEKTIQIHTEMGVLDKLISLPKKPIAVKWSIDESSSQGSGNLTVLLEFTETDKKYLVENSKAFEKERNDKIDVDFYNNWLPEEAKKSIKTKTINGNYELIDIKALQPNLFNKTELSPYVNGSITPLNHGFILLSLYSM